jgi:hypothetical protein
MNPAPVMLVLQLLLADGQEQAAYVVDFGLTPEDCDTALYEAPLPVTFRGTTVLYSCEAEDHE